MTSGSDANRLCMAGWRVLFVFLSGFCVLFVWLFIQFVSVMSFGNGFYPFFLFLYIVFNVWTTFDILSLKILNKPLIWGEEDMMGFGQVLPLVLMGIVVFNTVDVFRGRHSDCLYDDMTRSLVADFERTVSAKEPVEREMAHRHDHILGEPPPSLGATEQAESYSE